MAGGKSKAAKVGIKDRTVTRRKIVGEAQGQGQVSGPHVSLALGAAVEGSA